MANLSEIAEWEAGVYQIETTDPVLGGAPNIGTGAGMTNIPHLQLAKRTAWLKEQVDQLLLDIVAASDGLALKANIASPTFTGDPKAPTPAQFDNDTSLATSAFVQRALGNYRNAETVSAGFTILPADAGKAYVCGLASPITITLPAISATALGACFTILNTGTANVTVQRAGSDTIDNGPDAVTSVVLPPNSSLVIIRVAGTSLWHVLTPSSVNFSVGVGQTWQSVTRIAGTSYQNTTGRPIQVLTSLRDENHFFQVSQNGTTWLSLAAGAENASDRNAIGPVIGAGEYYRVTPGATIDLWVELR